MFDLSRGPRPGPAQALGAAYHCPSPGLRAHVLVGGTRVPSIVVDVMTHRAADSLTGVSSVGAPCQVDMGELNPSAVGRLINRRVSLAEHPRALTRQEDDDRVVLDLTAP